MFLDRKQVEAKEAAKREPAKDEFCAIRVCRKKCWNRLGVVPVPW